MSTKPRALILSLTDCSHYLAAWGHEAQGEMPDWRVVQGQAGKPKRFPSLLAAKCWWAGQGKKEAWLVMQSPYDEMIGNQGPVLDEMKLVIDADQCGWLS